MFLFLLVLYKVDGGKKRNSGIIPFIHPFIIPSILLSCLVYRQVAPNELHKGHLGNADRSLSFRSC